MTAATIVVPLINRWLGTSPKGMLNIVDLPEPGDAPFEDGDCALCRRAEHGAE